MTAIIMTYQLRGSMVESIHLSSAVVIGPDGDVAFAAGFTDTPTFVRSAAKPYQAIALHTSGSFRKYHLTPEDLALACASHCGEPGHLAAVGRFQERCGVRSEQLQCGPQFPMNRQAEEALLAQGMEPTSQQNNCSGKHTGFLSAAQALGAPLVSYLEPDHPVQREISAQICRLSGETEVPVGVDGCSAPTYYLPLIGLARLAQKLAAGDDPLLQPQFEAMTAFPFLVGGTGRFDTDFMMALKGRAVAKEGAEGVQTVAARDARGRGWGLAVKVLDGGSRPRAQVTLEILRSLRLVSDTDIKPLREHYEPRFANRAGRAVGSLVTNIPGGR